MLREVLEDELARLAIVHQLAGQRLFGAMPAAPLERLGEPVDGLLRVSVGQGSFRQEVEQQRSVPRMKSMRVLSEELLQPAPGVRGGMDAVFVGGNCPLDPL